MSTDSGLVVIVVIFSTRAVSVLCNPSPSPVPFYARVCDVRTSGGRVVEAVVLPSCARRMRENPPVVGQRIGQSVGSSVG